MASARYPREVVLIRKVGRHLITLFNPIHLVTLFNQSHLITLFNQSHLVTLFNQRSKSYRPSANILRIVHVHTNLVWSTINGVVCDRQGLINIRIVFPPCAELREDLLKKGMFSFEQPN